MKTILMMYVAIQGFGLDATPAAEFQSNEACLAALSTMRMTDEHHHHHHHRRHSGVPMAMCIPEENQTEAGGDSLMQKLRDSRDVDSDSD